MRTKRALLLAIVIVTSAFTGMSWADAPLPANADWNTALSLDVPGKGGWTTCYAFAKTLQGRFTQSGTECHLVIYNWTDQFHYSNRHAFVVYRDGAGRYWGMDNRSSKPRWMAGTNPAQWAAFWDQDKTIGRVIEEGPALADAETASTQATGTTDLSSFSRNTDWLAAAP